MKGTRSINCEFAGVLDGKVDLGLSGQRRREARL